MIPLVGLIQPAPSGGSLTGDAITTKMNDLGFLEAWQGDDASGGMVAASGTSAHDLVETNGTNVTYSQACTGFPSDRNKGVYFSGSGDATYLATSAIEAALQSTGDMTLVVMIHQDYGYPYGYTTVGLAAASDATADTNCLGSIGYESPASYSRGLAFHEYSTNADNKETFAETDPSNKVGGSILVAISRDTTAKEYTYFVNGVATGTQPYGSNPTGGADTKFVLGAALETLGGTIIQEWRTLGHAGLKHGTSTATDMKELMDTALNFDSRVGELPTGYINREGTTAIDAADVNYATVYGRNTALSQAIPSGANSTENKMWFVQMGTGAITITVTGTATGSNVTSGQGDIMQAVCTNGAAGNWTFTHL